VEICLEHRDILPRKVTPALADGILSHLKDIGLGVSSVSYHADGEEWGKRMAETVAAIDAAVAFKTDILIVNTERFRPGEKDAMFKGVVARMKELTAKAEAAGIRIAIEPEPLQVINDTADMLRMLDEVGSPALKVNLDVGHAYCTDDDILESIRRLGPAIVHTHIEDIKDRIHKHLHPGEGDMDLRAVCRTLAEVGYSGYYTIDLFSIADDPEGHARRARSELLSVAR
jgi:sugar phosphate isomerase/epimerase